MKTFARLALGILVLAATWSAPAAGEDPAALLKAGQWRQAEAAYGARLEADPDDPAAALGRAQAREKLGDVAGAERDYARAVELAPKSVEAWLRRAMFHEQHADDGRVVLTDYNALVELAPKNVRVYTLRGDFLVRVELFKEALVDAEKAVALKPDQAEAHLLRARALEGLRLHESATVSYHQALQLDPKNEKAKQGLTRMLAATGGPGLPDLTPLSEQVAAKAREYDTKGKKTEEIGLEAGRLYNPDQDPTVKARAIAAREEAQARAATNPAKANRTPAQPAAKAPGTPKPEPAPKTSTPSPVAAAKPPPVAAAPARPSELSARLRRATVLSIGTNGLFSETTRQEDLDALGLETQKAMLLGLCSHQLHLPLAWAGNEFYYAGPALDYGFGGRRPGEFLLWGRLGPDGESVAQLRFLWDRGEGSRLAFELVDLPVAAGTDSGDMSDLSYSLRHAAYCTGPELFGHVKRYANTRAPTSATRVENGRYVHANDEPTVLEYRPTEFSFGWFRSAKLSGDQLASRQSLAEVKQRLDRAFAEGSGWARVVAVTDEQLVRLYPARAAKRAAGGALEVQTGPDGKAELAADGHDRIRIKARVRAPSGQTQTDETGKIEFAADGDGAAWLDLTRAGEELEGGWKVIEAGASNPDPVRQGGATPPTHFEVKVTARSQGKVLTRQLKIPAAAQAEIDAKPDLVELSAQSGERAKVQVAIENAGPDQWSFRAEYAPKTRALARTEIRPLNRNSAELTLQEAGLDPAHDGSNTEVAVLRVLAEQPGKPMLERDIKVMVAQEGLFVAKTGLDPLSAQYLVRGDGSGAAKEIDFRVFAKNPRTGKVENLTRLPGTLASIRVESLEVKGTLAANVMEACRFRAEVRNTPRALNEPCGVLRLTLEKEVPGDGRTIPCDLKLTFVDRNEAVFSAIVSVGLVPSQEGPGSADWKVELGRCEEVIRKFVPAAYAPKMRALLDKQKTKLGVEGLRLLRHKIWMAAAELTLGEGGRGYDDEAKWANRIAETLDWAQWAGDMAFNAVVASWGGPYAAKGASVVKTLLISAINAYQDGQTPEQWLWENACSIPGYLEGKAIDPGTFEKLGMEKKVKIWGLYVAYHFFKNLYTERSVVQALKNVAANVGSNVLAGWLGDEVAKHGGKNARAWAGEKAQEAKAGAAGAIARITAPAAPTPKAVGSSTQNENAQAKPAYRPDAVAKAKPQPDRFAEAQKNRAIQDAKPLADGAAVFGDPAATPAPSAALPRGDGVESDSSALIRTRAVVGPDGKPYAHPDDVSRVMQDPSMVRALGDAAPEVRDAFENTRQTLFRQHDAIVVGHVKDTVPGLKNRTVRVLEFRTPRKSTNSLNTDRDYRVCYYDGVDAQGREIWVEVDRRKWEAASYLAFAKLTGGPTGSEAEVSAWAAKHQQVATDKSHIEASRDYSDQRVVADSATRTAKTISVRSNVERIREYVKDGQVRSTSLEDAQALGGMFEVKVGDAHFEHEAFVQANKAVDVFVDLRKAYNLEGRNVGQVPDKVLKAIEVVRQANGKLREDPNRRDPAALAAANKELQRLGYADLGDFMRKLGGQFESLKMMRPAD